MMTEPEAVLPVSDRQSDSPRDLKILCAGGACAPPGDG